jgi:hypothetical protein
MSLVADTQVSFDGTETDFTSAQQGLVFVSTNSDSSGDEWTVVDGQGVTGQIPADPGSPDYADLAVQLGWANYDYVYGSVANTYPGLRQRQLPDAATSANRRHREICRSCSHSQLCPPLPNQDLGSSNINALATRFGPI